MSEKMPNATESKPFETELMAPEEKYTLRSRTNWIEKEPGDNLLRAAEAEAGDEFQRWYNKYTSSAPSREYEPLFYVQFEDEDSELAKLYHKVVENKVEKLREDFFEKMKIDTK